MQNNTSRPSRPEKNAHQAGRLSADTNVTALPLAPAPGHAVSHLGLVGAKLHKERPVTNGRVAVALAVEHLVAVYFVLEKEARVEHGRVCQRRTVAATENAEGELRLLDHGSAHVLRAPDAVPERPPMNASDRARHRILARGDVVGKGVGGIARASAPADEHHTFGHYPPVAARGRAAAPRLFGVRHVSWRQGAGSSDLAVGVAVFDKWNTLVNSGHTVVH